MSSENFTLDEALQRIKALETKRNVKRVLTQLWSGKEVLNTVNITVPAINNYEELLIETTPSGNLRWQTFVQRLRDNVSVGIEDLNQAQYLSITFSTGRIVNHYNDSGGDNYLLGIYGITYTGGGLNWIKTTLKKVGEMLWLKKV